MAEYHGVIDRGSPTRQRVFARASGRATKTVTVKSGQVLKARSFLESDTTGKVIAHSGIVEKALVTFADILSTKTVILAGLTFTSTAACPKADLVAAFSGLTAGMTAAQANAQNPVATGSFTSGTLTGYNTFKSSTTASVSFVSTTPNAGVTDLADTGNGSGTTVAISSVNRPTNPIAGVLMFDVDASSADVEATAYIEGSFWDDALVWGINPAVDTITSATGTTIACTDYQIGALTDLTKMKFVEGSEFSELVFETAGEAV